MNTYKQSLFSLAYSLVAFLLIASMVVALPVFAQSADESEQDAQFAALTTSLSVIADQIAGSPDVTDEERLSLYTQLIQLSQAIATLQVASIQVQSAEIAGGGETSEAQTLVEAGLYRGIAEVDVEDYTAEVMLYYTDGDVNEQNVEVLLSRTYATQTLQYDLSTDEFEDLDFSATVIEARRQLAELIGEDENIDPAQLSGVLFISARNPLRDVNDYIETDSDEAEELAEDFGESSLITHIEFNPSDETGRIAMVTDQDEALIVSLSRQGLSDYYTLNVSMFIDTERNRFRQVTDEDGRNTRNVVMPKILYQEEFVERDEVLENLRGALTEITFGDSLVDIEDTFLAFMTENPVHVVRSNSSIYGPLHRGEQCLDEADRLIIQEIAVQLMQGQRAQFFLEPEFISVNFPIESEENPLETGCNFFTTFF